MDWIVGAIVALLVVLGWLGRDRPSKEPSPTQDTAAPRQAPPAPGYGEAPPSTASMRPEDAYEEGLTDGLAFGYLAHHYYRDTHDDGFADHDIWDDPDNIWDDPDNMWDDADLFDDALGAFDDEWRAPVAPARRPRRFSQASRPRPVRRPVPARAADGHCVPFRGDAPR